MDEQNLPRFPDAVTWSPDFFGRAGRPVMRNGTSGTDRAEITIRERLSRTVPELADCPHAPSSRLHLQSGGDLKFRQRVEELVYLFNDAFGRYSHSIQITDEANEDVRN
jgi:hypothetical protein